MINGFTYLVVEPFYLPHFIVFYLNRYNLDKYYYFIYVSYERKSNIILYINIKTVTFCYDYLVYFLTTIL